MNPAPHNPGKDAARLVGLAGSGNLKTPGAWIGWGGRVRKLPYKARLWLWRKLKDMMSPESYRYLKEWCERNGGNDDN
jgi:hypothetical protein